MFALLEKSIFALFYLLLLALSIAVAMQVGNQMFAGWDLTAHYYLASQFKDYFNGGRITGYNPLVFGGYPEFKFYPPLFYFIVVAIEQASQGYLSLIESFNLLICLLPVLFVGAVVFAGNTWSPEVRREAFMYVAILSLFYPMRYAHAGIGLDGLLTIGTVNGYLAQVFYLILLGLLSFLRRGSGWWVIVLAAFACSAIILTHNLTAVFTFWTLLCFGVLAGRLASINSLKILIFSLILTCFWWLPFLLSFDLTAGVARGLSAAILDPLFALFPAVDGARLLAGMGSLGWAAIAASICLPAFFLTIFFTIGMKVTLGERRLFIPTLLVISLLLLPRQIWADYLPFPLHYFRFIQSIMSLVIIVSGVGLSWIWKGYGRAEFVARFCFWILLLALGSEYVTEHKKGSRFPVLQNDFPAIADGQRMIEHIGGLRTDGAVVIEETAQMYNLLGSPHFFSTFLPWIKGVRVMPGLLSESAHSASFINSSLSGYSDAFTVAEQGMFGRGSSYNQGIEDDLKRLGVLGGQYILATSDKFVTALDSAPTDLVRLDRAFGPFRLYQLVNYRSLVSSPKFKPFLFLDYGGVSFQSLSRRWFADPRLFEYMIVMSLESPREISFDRFSGIIFNAVVPEAMSLARELERQGVNYFFLTRKKSQDNIRRIVCEKEGLVCDELAESLARYSVPTQGREATLLSMGRDGVKFHANGWSIFSLSYDTDLRCGGGESYATTPTQLSCFGSGNQEVSFID